MTNKSLNYDKYEGHTEGPWRVPKKHDRKVCDERGFKIAAALRYTKGTNFEISVEEANANAALIADAPLILQRCMELEEVAGLTQGGLELILMAIEDGENIGHVKFRLKDEINILNQALSKQRDVE